MAVLGRQRPEMPRRRREPEPVASAVVASATRYPGKGVRIYQPNQNWQKECYRHYGICGEARFAATYFGHAVSRATLGIAEMIRGVPVTVAIGPAVDALTALCNGAGGSTALLNSIGTHLTVAGECYLVGYAETDIWEVVSCIEMRVVGEAWQINYGNGMPVVDLTENDVVIRIWTPHPARRMEADSPFRSLLPILGEIEWLTRHIFAQITSRLSGAGILFMPQGMTFPPAPEVEGQALATSNEADAFMATLADAMLTPIETPDSPAATVPIVVTAPDDSIDKAKLLTFWSELDEASLSLRSEAIRRFALGMDLPPEEILGMGSRGGSLEGGGGSVSHWGAWQIEESTIKMHVEPMLDVIVWALTTGFLFPALGDSDSSVVYDTATLRLRPDRSKEAFELYDRGLITAEACRRENGFSEDDSPDVEEFKRWLLIKIASGSATPEQVAVAATTLGVPMPGEALPSRESRPPPSLEEHPTRPRTPAESTAILLAATEPLVFRALERAGNRLRQKGMRPPNVPAYETHCHVKANGSAAEVLADAWSCAPLTLQGLVDDPLEVTEALQAYCLTLIAEQSPHSRDRLSGWLSRATA